MTSQKGKGKTSMKRTKMFLVLAVVMVVLSVSAFVAPQAHAASKDLQVHTIMHEKHIVMRPSIYPVACSSVTLELQSWSGQKECYYGTGWVYPNFQTYNFWAHGWSGYLYTTTYGQIKFCNTSQFFSLNTDVGSIYVSPTKIC